MKVIKKITTGLVATALLSTGFAKVEPTTVNVEAIGIAVAKASKVDIKKNKLKVNDFIHGIELGLFDKDTKDVKDTTSYDVGKMIGDRYYSLLQDGGWDKKAKAFFQGYKKGVMGNDSKLTKEDKELLATFDPSTVSDSKSSSNS